MIVCVEFYTRQSWKTDVVSVACIVFVVAGVGKTWSRRKVLLVQNGHSDHPHHDPHPLYLGLEEDQSMSVLSCQAEHL